MSTRNKYRPGYYIRSLNELVERLRRGEYVYLGDRLVHPQYILHMPLNVVDDGIEAPLYKQAIDQRKERYEKLVRDFHTLPNLEKELKSE